MSPDSVDTDKHPLPEDATAPGGGPGDLAAGQREEWALVRYLGQPLGEMIRLAGKRFTIGRASDNEIVLVDPEVSRHHAHLSLAAGAGGSLFPELEDLDSTNGTFVNGRRLYANRGTVPLRPGDVLRFGGNVFKLKRMDELERQFHQTVLTRTSVDPLTGVANRGAVLGYLERQFDLARRYGRPLSVALGDLDHFKRINDTFGHAAGDQVLRQYGEILAGRLRGSDMAGRIGGEEFLLVLPETRAEEALAVAEDLRLTLSESIFLADGHAFAATLSQAAVAVGPEDASVGALLARADVVLYRAKAHGRNRVEADP